MAPSRVTLAACAIFRDEASYLEEWIRFHRLVGIERFYLYDNRSTDGWRDVLAATGAADVVVVHWPIEPGQLAAYNHCLAAHGGESEWIAFFDLDEFLFPTDAGDLRRHLADYPGVPAVGVNWVVYGSSFHQVRPPGLVTRNYVRRGAMGLVIRNPWLLRAPDLDPGRLESYRPHFVHMKSIVRPAETIETRTPHSFRFRGDAKAVDETGRPIDGSFTESVNVERLRVNHYWSKSIAELEAKARRGHATGGAMELASARAKERALNTEVDTAAFPVACRVPGWTQPGRAS